MEWKRYVARDKSGALYSFSDKPKRAHNYWFGCWPIRLKDSLVPQLTWEDEPVEMNRDLYDKLMG